METQEAETANGNTYDIKKDQDDFFDDAPAKGANSPIPESGKENGVTSDQQSNNGEEEPSGHQQQPEQNGQQPENNEQQEEQTEQQSVENEQQADQEHTEEGEVNATSEGTGDPVVENGEQESEVQQENGEVESPASDGDAQVSSPVQVDQADNNSNREESEKESAQLESTQVEQEAAGGEDGQTLAVSDTHQDRLSKASSYEDDYSSSTDTEGQTKPPAREQTPDQEDNTSQNQDEEAAQEEEPPVGGEEEEAPLEADEACGNIDDDRSDSAAQEAPPGADGGGRESRAAMEPVVIAEPEVKTDGRSTPGMEDKDGNRGEDRSEGKAPEGTEDSRGQGQWRPEGEQSIQDAVMQQKTEKEQLDQMAAEKEKLQQEYDALKEENEHTVKDLQERLAILARENEEKDRRILKLEKDVSDTTNKLRDTERRLFAAETSNSATGGEPPKSKTCIIM